MNGEWVEDVNLSPSRIRDKASGTSQATAGADALSARLEELKRQMEAVEAQGESLQLVTHSVELECKRLCEAGSREGGRSGGYTGAGSTPEKIAVNGRDAGTECSSTDGSFSNIARMEEEGRNVSELARLPPGDQWRLINAEVAAQMADDRARWGDFT